ncbi:MAG TPA: hypothetical protein O0X27_02960 [Methanocorpusculum sp.]|nr:hypothetical protein [Methanocorpusculum sp.]
MKIAVTSENGQVFQHFGATPEFTVYTVENGTVTDKKAISTNGTGHEALADILAELDAEILICGGIGGGARAAIASVGIELYPGVTGSTDDAIAAFVAGTLQFNPNFVCNHHHGCSH